MSMSAAKRSASQVGTAAPRRTLSVRLRLMIVAVLVVLPLLAERIYNEQIDRNDRVEAAYKQALSLARQGAATQNEVLVALRAILQSVASARATFDFSTRSEEHTSELQSRRDLVSRLLLEKKKIK